MKQIIQFDEELREKINCFEKASEKICRELKQQYQQEFENVGQRIVIELIRIKNGKSAINEDIFEDHYESFVEIGVEQGSEYYPNGYIPIWKVKTEWFQKVGYLTNHDVVEMEYMVHSIVREMLEDRN